MSDTMTLREAVQVLPQHFALMDPMAVAACNALLAHAERTLAVQDGEPEAIKAVRTREGE